MPELDDRQLDLAIRDLVGRAAADAPAPPSADALAARPLRLDTDDARNRTNWVVTGIAGMSIAAAVVGLLVMNRPDDIAEAPATEPATAPTLAPTTPRAEDECTLDRLELIAAIRAYHSQQERYPASQADLVAAEFIPAEYPTYVLAADGRDVVRVAGVPCAEPNTTVPTGETVPVIEPSVVVTGSESTPAPTSAPTAPATTPAPIEEYEYAAFVVSGPAGVEVQPWEGPRVAVSGQPARIATRTADGSTWMQTYDPEVADAAEPLMVVRAGSDAAEIVDVPGVTGSVRLHDAATVDGETVVLLEQRPATCAGFDGCVGSIWVYWPGRATAEMIDERSVWESGWSGLALADTGVIVGTWSESITESLYSTTVPGVDVQPVEAADVGLEDSYSDCAVCPRSFTIDRLGAHVGWIDVTDDGTGAVIVTRLADSATGGAGFSVDDVAMRGVLDIGNVDVDGAGTGSLVGTAFVNGLDPATPSAVRIDLAGETPPEPLAGSNWAGHASTLGL